VALEKTLPKLRFDILTDMRKLLLCDDENVTCIWNPCDPYTTSAVRGVDGQGNKSNCGRTNKDGIMRLKAEVAGYERQVALHYTPQADGGCQDCRFFLMCKGQCPGTAIDGDWRNRTADCAIWMALFETLETELLAQGQQPLSLAPDRLALEATMVGLWGQGRYSSLKYARAPHKSLGVITAQHGDNPHGDGHGDHTDTPAQEIFDTASPARELTEHGDSPHGDRPHGDDHGDHDDHADAEHGDSHGDSDS
jgi:uncharacterized protein